MRKLHFFVVAIVLLGNVAWSAQALAQGPNNTSRDIRWSVEAGARGYSRPGTELTLPLITDALTLTTLFDSNQATDLGNTAGAEVKFNFVTKNGREMEIRGILANWDQETTIEGANMVSPFFPVGGPNPTSVVYGYEADFFSMEIMARRAIAPGVTLMFGPRFVSTKDRVNIAGSLEVNPGGGAPFITVTETNSYETTNALIGLQTGFEFNLPVSQSVYVNSFIRVGGYTNPTEFTTTNTSSITTTVTTTRQTHTTGAFLGEVGGRVYFDLIPNSVSSYVGYEATWIDGLAIAPAQLLSPAGSGVDTTNTPFFQAITFGVRMNY